MALTTIVGAVRACKNSCKASLYRFLPAHQTPGSVNLSRWPSVRECPSVKSICIALVHDKMNIRVLNQGSKYVVILGMPRITEVLPI